MTFIIPIISALLWRIGGWRYKVARRYILPTTPLFFFNLQYAIPAAVLLSAATTLPYGDGMREKLGLWFRPYTFLVGASYGAALLPLAWHSSDAWRFPVSTSLVFGGLMWLSNKYNSFKWWVVEVCIGFTVGCLMV